MLDKNKVVVGMSGGVDSTVAAYLLKKQGYDVIGVHLKVWDDADDTVNDGGCCSIDSANDALRVCDALGIPFYVLNYKKRFKEKVIDDFVDEYRLGRTPNPCIQCNKHIKFDDLLRKAHELGAYYVATGHYSEITFNEETKRYNLSKSKEKSKDQTYMLYVLDQYQLTHTLMPLGGFSSKEEVRKIAENLDVYIASKGDSQDICFIPDGDYKSFLKKQGLKSKKGDFVDMNGNVLGKHTGITDYTVGQRKGLGISFGKPMFVVDIDAKKNRVVLGDTEDIFKSTLIATDFNFIMTDGMDYGEEYSLSAKVRYSHHEEPCRLSKVSDSEYKIEFDRPVRAITPGQSVVLYDGNMVFGGGLIKKAI